MTKNKKGLIFLFFSSLLFLAMAYFGGNKIFRDNIDYKVFKTDAGWGYNILVNKRIFIHQEYIPAIIGNNPFPNKEAAKKAAKMIIIKLKMGQIPAITKEDLKKLQI